MSRRSPISRPIDVFPLAALLFSVTCWVRYRNSRPSCTVYRDRNPPEIKNYNALQSIQLYTKSAQSPAPCPESVLIGGVSALNWRCIRIVTARGRLYLYLSLLFSASSFLLLLSHYLSLSFSLLSLLWHCPPQLWSVPVLIFLTLSPDRPLISDKSLDFCLLASYASSFFSPALPRHSTSCDGFEYFVWGCSRGPFC